MLEVCNAAISAVWNVGDKAV